MINYEDALKYIHSVKWQGSKPGLSRTRELLSYLGNPDKKLRFVHVAGTNGKGSTAACLASILKAAGYKTGLYTSPYINSFCERMQINGEQIKNDRLCALVERVRPFADKMADAPTEFEMITALAMLFFAEEECDIVVLEAGLGGELDSTNVIPTPLLSVICAIGLDHTAVLGDTVEQIASAKAGIIKAGGDVLIYGRDKSAEEVFSKKCESVGAVLHKADFSRIRKTELSLFGTKLVLYPYGELLLSLAGSYQPYNATLAVSAAELLRTKGFIITDEQIKEGLASVSWPGRFELISKDPLFVLDGAHNPHGMKAAVESIKACLKEEKKVFLVGAMADKDVLQMMRMLCEVASEFICVTPNNPRAMDAKDLASLLCSCGAEAEAFQSIGEGVSAAMERAGKSGAVCALGSLYFSADVRTAVNNIK